MIRVWVSVLFLVSVILTPLTWAAELKPERVDGAPLWPVHYFAPPAGGTKIDGLIVLISDRRGWDDAAEAMARRLTQSGEVVVGLDFMIYKGAIAKDTNPCTLVDRDLEVLARAVEMDLPFPEYRPPVILGLGAGAGIAYAAIGEVLPNTFAGGVGLGFDPVIDVGHRLCLPTEPTPPDAPVRYGPVTDHETPFLFTPARPFAAPDGGLSDFLKAMPQAHQLAGKTDDLAAADEAIRRIPRVGKGEESVSGLPLVELPPKGGVVAAHPLVIFYSGDGGWRDIDKKIGGYLSDEGYFVVGIDSLRYFWRKKDPGDMARDLDRLIRHYGVNARTNGVILVGYSFGADLLPFMLNRMAADTRSEIRLAALLGISERASFEIRLQGILGASNADGPPTLPELAKIRNIPVLCVFGVDEHDSVCARKELDSVVDRVRLSGGHHFDGDYRHTADLIVSADKSRLAKMDKTK